MEWDKNTKIIVAVIVVIILIAAGAGIALAMNNNSGNDTANVTYDGNGGATRDGKTIYTSTSTIVEGCNFIKSGSTFEKWVDGDKSYNPGDKITGTHTLKAQWKEDAHHAYAKFSDRVGVQTATVNGKAVDISSSFATKIELTSKEVNVEIVSSNTLTQQGTFQNRAYYSSTTTTTSQACIVVFVAYDENGKVLNSTITQSGNTLKMKINLDSIIDFYIDFNCCTSSVLDGDGGAIDVLVKQPYFVYVPNEPLEADTFIKTGYTIDSYLDLNNVKHNIGSIYDQQTGGLTVLKAIWKPVQ